MSSESTISEGPAPAPASPPRPSLYGSKTLSGEIVKVLNHHLGTDELENNIQQLKDATTASTAALQKDIQDIKDTAVANNTEFENRIKAEADKLRAEAAEDLRDIRQRLSALEQNNQIKISALEESLQRKDAELKAKEQQILALQKQVAELTRNDDLQKSSEVQKPKEGHKSKPSWFRSVGSKGAGTVSSDSDPGTRLISKSQQSLTPSENKSIPEPSPQSPPSVQTEAKISPQPVVQTETSIPPQPSVQAEAAIPGESC